MASQSPVVRESGRFRGEWRKDSADGSDGHGNLDECFGVLILYYDALDVAFMDQVADLIDEIAAQELNFFCKILETRA